MVHSQSTGAPINSGTPPMQRIVLASSNPGKLREFNALFATSGC
jgi:hypothetical protein